ncbi:F-box/kelch-repeat protein At3g23880-like [Vicia villosa]|uniref:F-box/kelch-repeat protein At3g23880-like n=1 Tax=Vicia villosa TaxID=3911 RepID=UPI00273B9729|nr:F-box/kelch-repeat protein At3g23880-like [Vicia villosa]
MSLLFLPEELVAEVLSYLPAKSLTQLRCVSKSWNTLISDPQFIKLHLQRSKKNRNLTQILCMSLGSYILPFPLNTLLNNPSIINSTKDYFPYNPKYRYIFVGSCNGLFCFVLTLYKITYPENTWFQLWNPATNTLSKIYTMPNFDYFRFSGFSFGYDNSADTYKFVYFRPNKLEIFSFGSNVWKIIQLPHTVPLNHLNRVPYKRKFLSEAMYLNDTIYLLAREIAKQIVIISLKLGNDTYSKLLPPQDFVEVSLHLPTIHVMEESLYFSHHTQEIDFIIWKMTEFGTEKCWIQFLKISYEDLNIHPEYKNSLSPWCLYGSDFDIHMKYKYFLAPLCLYESGIILVQAANGHGLQVIVYNWIENRIEKTRMDSSVLWMVNQNYVESLVPTS